MKPFTPRRDFITSALGTFGTFGTFGSLGALAPWGPALSAQPSGSAQENSFYPAVKPRALIFPQDHGAHPDYRTEWWYLTGWLGEGRDAMGFQLTFFRSKTQHPSDNPSRLAPKQLLFAHAALSNPQEDRYLHANRSGRLSGTRLSAAVSDTALQFDDWALHRLSNASEETYEGQFAGEGFAVSFKASTHELPLLRGHGGVSPKGPQAQHSSYYYSRAPLAVNAQVKLGPRTQSMQGVAWLDHEWSSQVLMPGAVGWDWLGINLLGGGTLMAFQIRNAQAQALYAQVDARDRQGQPRQDWRRLRWIGGGPWRSKSLIEYPIPMNLELDGVVYRLEPLMLAQEVDARTSTGGFYWEGAVCLMQGDKRLGFGYLELTGYGAPLNV